VTVRAVVVSEFGGPEALQVIEVARPEPEPGEVRVRVAAAPVNPTDLQARSGEMVRWGAAAPRSQVGLGVDVAGTIDAVGSLVHRYSVGDRVIGLRERLDQPLGAYAEYVVLDQSGVAPAPPGVAPELASTLPLNATTADQALRCLDLQLGQWLLVTGAAGAVGGFAVELAKLHGLRVIGSSAPRDQDDLMRRGVDLFVDDRGGIVADQVRALIPGGVDGALDAANLGVPACDAVRHGGAFVSVLNNAPQARRGIRTTNLAYHCDAPRLAELSLLAAAGALSMRVAGVLPLTEAAQAHRLTEKGGVRGRLVLVPNSAEAETLG